MLMEMGHTHVSSLHSWCLKSHVVSAQACRCLAWASNLEAGLEAFPSAAWIMERNSTEYPRCCAGPCERQHEGCVFRDKPCVLGSPSLSTSGPTPDLLLQASFWFRSSCLSNNFFHLSSSKLFYFVCNEDPKEVDMAKTHVSGSWAIVTGTQTCVYFFVITH